MKNHSKYTYKTVNQLITESYRRVREATEKLEVDKFTGSMARAWYNDLKESEEDGGCCSLMYASDDKYNYFICMGWTNDGEKDVIACKIGRQTHNNGMQTDIDIDFEMPYNEETGDVDDTWCKVTGDENWNELAQWLRKSARRVFNENMLEDGEYMSDINRKIY